MEIYIIHMMIIDNNKNEEVIDKQKYYNYTTCRYFNIAILNPKKIYRPRERYIQFDYNNWESNISDLDIVLKFIENAENLQIF